MKEKTNQQEVAKKSKRRGFVSRNCKRDCGKLCGYLPNGARQRFDDAPAQRTAISNQSARNIAIKNQAVVTAA